MPATAENPLNLPWRVEYDYERIVLDANGSLIGTMNTAEQAQAVVEAVSAGDVDARREVTRLTALVGHYKHRMAMTPSTRQDVLGEGLEESIQPENWYIVNVERPAKNLRDSGVTALELLKAAGAAKDDPACVALREALEAFERDTPDWW